MPTVHCAACIGKIERRLASVIGMTTVRVNLSMKRLSISGDANPDTVLKTLSGFRFEAYPLNLEALTKARDDKGKTMFTRLAVAGFAMMNVMLLSVAVWPGATHDLFT